MAFDYTYVLPPTGPADNSIVREMFDDIKTYVNALVPSGGAAPLDARYVTLTTNATLTQERVLTAGTAISLTDNGAGSTVVVTNTGVTSIVAGSGISISGGTGAVTVTNTNATAGANTALSNLASVAINLSLLPGTTDTIDLGSASKTWRDIHIDRDIVLYEETTANTILIKAPTSLAPYTFTFPDTGGTSGYVLRTDGSGTTSWVAQPGSGTFATKELDNLGTTAVNAAIKPGVTNSVDLGSVTFCWRDLYVKGGIRFQETVAGSDAVFLAGPSSVATGYTFTLPPTGGTNNYILKTDGSGTTDWVSAGSIIAGATVALDNLSSVAINTSLLPGSDLTIDLGSSTKMFDEVFARNLYAGKSGTPGLVEIWPSTASKGTLVISAADNAGATDTTIINASQAGARTYTIPDAGASASFVMTAGAQTIGGTKTFSSQIISSATSNHLKLATATSNAIISVATIATADRTITIPDPGTNANFVLSEAAATINGQKTFGSDILLPDGAVGTPSWAFSADTNNGAYRIGTDNWALAAAGAKIWETSAAGEITQPLQPSFLVTDGTGATDVTGDGTSYTELWPTEIYDQNADFATNTFTAPITGRYLLCASVGLTGFGASHTRYDLSIVTSNRTYRSPMILTAGTMSSINQKIAVIADMDAADTATVTVVASGSTKIVDVIAAASDNHFSGSLIN